MPTEIITVVVSVFITVAPVLSGMFTLLHMLEVKLEKRFDQIAERFTETGRRIEQRFDAFSQRLSETDRRIYEKFSVVHEEISALRAEVRTIAVDVVDLKVAVARLEGSRQTLLRAH